jgi:hypothetical protein
MTRLGRLRSYGEHRVITGRSSQTSTERVAAFEQCHVAMAVANVDLFPPFAVRVQHMSEGIGGSDRVQKPAMVL